jgi:glycosyltransferase involved in cell wall biosynthesis
MNVTHLILSLDVGGLERNVVNQVREGRELGQSVSVVCLEGPGALSGQVEDLGGHLISMGKAPGIRPSAVVRLGAILRDLRPDILHTHQIGTLFYAGPAAASLGMKRSFVVHTEHGREPYATSARRRWLGRMAGLHARRFFCLTHDMADDLVNHRIVPRSKIQVIDNGIDIDRFRDRGDPAALRRSLGIPEGVPVIGTVGRLVEVKRHDVLIRAFAELRREVPEAHLVIVGDGPRKDEILALIGQLGLQSSVHLAGYQAEAWKFPYIMDCFALTSRSEGMPQAVLEAAIAAVPIVAHRVGGLPELIEHEKTGILVAPDEPSALTRALLNILASPENARRMGRAARERVELRFHVRRMARVYHDHFLQILGRTGAASAALSSRP